MLTNLGARLRRWRRRFSRAEWETDRLRLSRSTAPSHAPGLLLVQIDGLSRTQFERAIATRRLPFIARLLNREGCRLHTFYSGQPATTPAVQGEIHYGVKTAVPAFSFLDPAADSVGVMYDSEWAKRIEAGLAKEHEGLLKDGSSWSNIYTGGATQEESHFCGASLGLGDLWRTGKIRNLLLFVFLHFGSCLRLLALLPIEGALALWDALRGVMDGHRLKQELFFIIGRVFVCVGLRELITLGAKIDLARGLPVIHVNFLGYDEQSHRRGPGSHFAHWTLLGIDRAIRHLHRAARRSDGRDYEVWIFSDHGQVACQPFSRLVEGGLEGLVQRSWPGDAAANRPVAPPAPRPNWVSHAPRFRQGHPSGPDRSRLSPFSDAEHVVACMGPVGHIYFKTPLAPADELALAHRLLAGGVPGVLRRVNDQVVWLTRKREVLLPGDTSLLRGPAELLPMLAADLVRLVGHPCSGNLVCLGWSAEGASVSFAEENGAHCGPSPEEVQGFLVVPPASSHLLPGAIIRPAALRTAARIHLGRDRRPRHVRHRATAPSRLRVVTYNIHYCRGLDGRFAPDRIARILRDLDPDLVAVQEVDVGRPRSRGDDQLTYLAHELGLHCLFAPSVVNGEERYGHGLLSTHPLSLVTQVRLPTGGSRVIEPRDALHASMTLGGQTVSVITTHLGLAYPERSAQVARLLADDFLGGIPPGQPALFLGDLNFAPGGRLYRQLVADWSRGSAHPLFRDVQAHAPGHTAVKTFPSFLPVRQLDHIFVSSQFKILAVHSPANLLTRRASDHLPLVADLELPHA
jgi:endonuclease/exonuclease/phosphatase family metal-dependent hydrolase